MIGTAVGGIGGGLSVLAKALAALYGAANGINEFLDRHIADLQSSSNETIATTGRILEMAKFGFGLGYLSSVIVIAAGQFLLGNPLGAAAAVATAATMSNPIAMTCGAIGAVVYGWGALGTSEREALLDRLAQGAEVGIELVRSVLAFVVAKAHALLSSDALKAFKQFIAEKAELFGRSLSDITHSAMDVVADGLAAAKRRAGIALANTAATAEELTTSIGETMDSLSKAASNTLEQSGLAAKEAMQRVKQMGRADGEDD